MSRVRKRKDATKKAKPVASNEREAFLAGVQSRVGGRYCTPPRAGCTDCSGLVCEEYRKATGREISCDSHALYRDLPSVSRATLLPTDLVFWDTGWSERHGNRASHVGVYVGNGRVVNALNEQRGIVDSSLDGDYGGPLLGYRRLPLKETVQPTPEPAPRAGDVTPHSPFRGLGNTDIASFRAALSRSLSSQPSPLAREAEAIYTALAPYGLTRLGAAMAWVERSNDTNDADLGYYGRELHNAWAVKNPDGSWARYPSYGDAAHRWRERILGPTYADLTTLAQFIGRYAPWSDGNNPDDYGAKVARLINDMPLVSGETTKPPVLVTTPAPVPLDPWRPYPYPPMVDLLVAKPGEGAGFDRVAPRGPRIVGACNHITDGEASIEWYAQFFSTGGERAWDALVDTVIGRDGRIGLLNDWRNPDRGGRRAGWANGTATGLEGDGVAFYRRYPLINDVLVSKEHVGRAGQRMTDAQMAASIELSTAIAQSVRCPWESYPYHPGMGGVNIEQMHFWFAPKACPAEPFISTYYPVLVREVKANLKAWQGGVATNPAPPPDPVWFTRFGFSLEQISEFFGTMTRFNEDGTTDELPFSPTGALSLLWLNRCDAEGKFPESESITYHDSNLSPGREAFATWEGGWVSWLALGDSRASWRWLDSEDQP